MKNTIQKLESISNDVRKLVLKMTTDAGSGHIAGPLGISDVMTYLYYEELNIKKVKKYFDKGVQRDSVLSPNRDRFVLSAAHMVPVLYAVLMKKEFIEESEVNTLRKLGSRLQGHTHIDLEIGVETSGGSLGQGVSIACGFAMNALIYGESYRTYCVLGDGESNEGSVWESAMFASKYKLDNLVYILDSNNIQQSNFGDVVMPMLSQADKWKAFGWNVIEINGNDFEQIDKAFLSAKDFKSKPSIIIAKTTAGKGVSFIENNYIWHSKVLDESELKEALVELGE